MGVFLIISFSKETSDDCEFNSHDSKMEENSSHFIYFFFQLNSHLERMIKKLNGDKLF